MSIETLAGPVIFFAFVAVGIVMAFYCMLSAGNSGSPKAGHSKK